MTIEDLLNAISAENDPVTNTANLLNKSSLSSLLLKCVQPSLNLSGSRA
jgi:hypothetical protein